MGAAGKAERGRAAASVAAGRTDSLCGFGITIRGDSSGRGAQGLSRDTRRSLAASGSLA
jgi:hypothetical protein